MEWLKRLRHWLRAPRPRSKTATRRGRRNLQMMELEPRLLMTSYHFDFGTSTSPCASGYTAVPIVAYNPQLGYGWSNTSGISAIDRGTGNNLTRAFQTGSNGTFEVSLPNGTYQVTPTLGDAAAIREVSDLYLEGRNVASNVTTQAGQFIQPAYGVKVTNGLLTVRLADNGGMTSGWALDGLDVVADTGPTASAGPNQTVKEDSPVNFTGLASGFGPFQYQWQFGDGSSATGITPQHTYVAAGAYSVLFAVTDAYGLTAQSSMVVTVSNVPPSVALVGAPAVSGVGVPITLGSTVTDPIPAEMAAGFTYTWSVSENGSPLTSATGASPSFTFTPASQGTCVVNVTATAADGNTSPTSSAAIVVSVPTVALVGAPAVSGVGVPITLGSTVTDPIPAEMAAGFTYTWSVSENGSPLTSATGASPSFTFTPASQGTCVVNVTATAADGNTSPTSSAAIVVSVPTVALTGVPTSTVLEGTAITLGSTVSDNAAETAAGFSYAWSVTKNGSAFTSATGVLPNFTFAPADNATYVVSLQVTNAGGGTSAAVAASITVVDVPPRPDALGPYTGTAGIPTAFVGIAQDPSAVDQAAGFSYTWNFGDGTTATGATPVHTYAVAGKYTVTLTATDKDGGARSTTTTATIGSTASTAPQTEYQIDATNLLANVQWDNPNWSQMAADGAWGVNAQWEQGTSSVWYIEEQRYGQDLIIAGLLHDNTAAINAGFTAFNWGFAHQAADGSFAGTGDPFHSTSYFVEAVANTCLLIEQSPYAEQYQSQVHIYAAELDKAAQWMITPSVWSRGLADDAPYTHRRYMVADALGFTSLLVGGDSNLMAMSRYEIQCGLALQLANGANPELGSYDSSYQTVGLSLAERWATYFPGDSLTPAVQSMISKGLAWEDSMILPSGEVSTAGDTRIGSGQTGPSGTVKTVNWEYAADAFAYWYQVTGNPQWQADAQKISQFYYNVY